MKRKLIKQGIGGLTVCIPKHWAREHSLEAGDEIEVQEEQGNLVVSTHSRAAPLKKEIVIDEHSPEFMTRLLTNAYKKGVDELKLKFKTDIPLETIGKALSALTIGYEITDVGRDYCIIQSFSAEQEDNIAVSIRKCFFLIKEMQQLLEQEGDVQNHDAISMLHENIHKLTNYAIRTTAKTIHDNTIIQYNTLIFTNVHLYSRKLKYIHQQLRKEKRIFPSTRALLQDLFSLFELFYDAYYKQQLPLVHQFLRHKEQLAAKIDKAIDKGNGQILLQVSMALRNVHDSIGAVVGLIIR